MNEVHYNLSGRFCSIKTKEHVNLQKQTGQTQPEFEYTHVLLMKFT